MPLKDRDKRKLRLNRKQDDGRQVKRNKRSSRFFAPGEVSLLREGIRFVFTDASRIMKKRIADAVKKGRNVKRGCKEKSEKKCRRNATLS